MVTLFVASDSILNVFLGLFDKPLDNPAPFDGLLELAATRLGVIASGFDLNALFIREPVQMPLEEIQGPHSPGDRLGGLSSSLLEDTLLVGFQLSALLFEPAHDAPGLRERLGPLLLLVLAHTRERRIAFWTPYLHNTLLRVRRTGQLNACRMPSAMPSNSEGSKRSCRRNCRILGISTSASSISGLLPFTYAPIFTRSSASRKVAMT